ncbi:hypothetical protein Pelo_15700 [Pelomyxa schiedti]|nr:hypothetical protein Pelo_15700 [Pelomyxa schiedti]
MVYSWSCLVEKSLSCKQECQQDVGPLVPRSLECLANLEGLDVILYKQVVLPELLHVIDTKSCSALLKRHLIIEILRKFPYDFHLSTLDILLHAMQQQLEDSDISQVTSQLLDVILRTGKASRTTSAPPAVNVNGSASGSASGSGSGSGNIGGSGSSSSWGSVGGLRGVSSSATTPSSACQYSNQGSACPRAPDSRDQTPLKNSPDTCSDHEETAKVGIESEHSDGSLGGVGSNGDSASVSSDCLTIATAVLVGESNPNAPKDPNTDQPSEDKNRVIALFSDFFRECQVKTQRYEPFLSLLVHFMKFCVKYSPENIELLNEVLSWTVLYVQKAPIESRESPALAELCEIPFSGSHSILNILRLPFYEKIFLSILHSEIAVKLEANEQQLIADTVHLISPGDQNSRLEILNFAVELFTKGGPTLRQHGLSCLIFHALRSVQHQKSHVETTLLFCCETSQLLSNTGNKELGLKLLLQTATAASNNSLDELCNTCMLNAFTIYEYLQQSGSYPHLLILTIGTLYTLHLADTNKYKALLSAVCTIFSIHFRRNHARYWRRHQHFLKLNLDAVHFCNSLRYFGLPR